MEILSASRQVTVTALEILAHNEETALFMVKGDAAREEEVRRQFAVRRENPEPGPDYEFEVAPVDFFNQMQAMELAEKRGKGRGDTATDLYLLGLLQLLSRITSWKGFEQGGEPLPCTLDNKILVFGQALPVIQALQGKLSREQAAEEKNSGTSASG